ncbi:amidohydrolase family protein [Paenibacillus sp. FSL H8-0537]|uniref:amidohydrolase family protein n=1 Tax=Paenibacillus sp. FSL H8-0537 TaxID=2921399 RepID=UPI003100DB1E
MRIDAHQHYWAIERGDYGWITAEVPVLYRDYGPEHLQPSLNRHGISHTIAVQAAPTLAETDYLLALSDRTESIAGVVGFLDLFDPEHLSHFARFERHQRFVGFRVMIQELQNANVILQQTFVEALKEYEQRDTPIDLLLTSHQLDSLVQVMKQVPNLRGVIDHLAKPRIAAGELDPWRSQLTELARYPKLYCKLSGMVTEASHDSWRPEHFIAYIRHVLEAFGPDRVMFGSDWPVCLLAAGYDEVVDVLEQALPASWGDAERSKLFGLNAKEFYKL